MPYYKRRYKRRPFYRKKATFFRKKGKRGVFSSKKRFNKKSSTSIIKSPTAFPDSILCKFVYTERVTLTTAGGETYYIFRGNSLYDPNETGVGAQPMAFDEWSYFYERYRVFGSRMVCTMTSSDAVATECVLVPHIDNSGFADLRTACAAPYARFGICLANSQSVLYLKNYMSSKKIFEVKDLRDFTEGSALTTANPSKGWYWILHLKNQDGGDLSIAVFFKITYYAEMYRQNELAMS